jgi:hypothetical protein
MIGFLTRMFSPKLAVPVLAGLVIVVMVVAGLAIRSCTRDNTAQRQAEQTTASGDAYANAAENAIDTIGNRVVTERDIDNAINNVQQEILNAQDPAAIRSAVLDSVCRSPSHRNDPACAVR